MAIVSQYVIAKVNGHLLLIKAKRKGFPYSIPSVGPGADRGVQAVSPQVTISHSPGDRLPFLSARPAVTSPAAQHHRPVAGTKLYCLVRLREAHRCEQQLAQGCYAALPRVGFEPVIYWSQVQHYIVAPPRHPGRVGGRDTGALWWLPDASTLTAYLCLRNICIIKWQACIEKTVYYVAKNLEALTFPASSLCSSNWSTASSRYTITWFFSAKEIQFIKQIVASSTWQTVSNFLKTANHKLFPTYCLVYLVFCLCPFVCLRLLWTLCVSFSLFGATFVVNRSIYITHIDYITKRQPNSYISWKLSNELEYPLIIYYITTLLSHIRPVLEWDHNISKKLALQIENVQKWGIKNFGVQYISTLHRCNLPSL